MDAGKFGLFFEWVADCCEGLDASDGPGCVGFSFGFGSVFEGDLEDGFGSVVDDCFLAVKDARDGLVCVG